MAALGIRGEGSILDLICLGTVTCINRLGTYVNRLGMSFAANVVIGTR
jgi:hypothetical protein